MDNQINVKITYTFLNETTQKLTVFSDCTQIIVCKNCQTIYNYGMPVKTVIINLN